MKELILVTSEAQLRTGMKILVKRCRVCKSDREFILLNAVRVDDHYAWKHAPNCDWWGRPINFESSIAEGRVFRIEDGLEQMDRVVTKEKELTE